MTEILKAFTEYLYGQQGLSSTTVHNHISTIRRVTPVLGEIPTQRLVNMYMTDLRLQGKSAGPVSDKLACRSQGRSISA